MRLRSSDVRGFFGLDKTVWPGLQSVHVEAHITGPRIPIGTTN